MFGKLNGYMDEHVKDYRYIVLVGVLLVTIGIALFLLNLEDPELPEDAKYEDDFEAGEKKTERIEEGAWQVWVPENADPGKVTIRYESNDTLLMRASSSDSSRSTECDGVTYNYVGSFDVPRDAKITNKPEGTGTVLLAHPVVSPWALCACFMGLSGIIVFVYAYMFRERQRKNALMRAAAELGLTFYDSDPYNIAHKYGYLDALRRGKNRYAFNILSGWYRDHGILVFDFHYEIETGMRNKYGREQNVSKYFCGAILFLAKDFPELIVRKEGIWDKAVQSVGFEDIDLDNYEFSRTFMVKCKSQKFAYDIFHPRMMELFLEIGDISLEIEHDTMMIRFKDTMKAQYLKPRLDSLVRIRQSFPNYLFADDTRFMETLQAPGQSYETFCPVCSNALSYIQEYNSWYCYTCEDYPFYNE